MNQVPAIQIWRGSNRLSLLWEDLLVNSVPPDPIVLMADVKNLPGRDKCDEPAEPSLLEKAGFESLRLIRQALEILSAPPENEPLPDLDPAGPSDDPWMSSATPGLAFIKVSSEPEPQPGSTINTRRMAYGLKIPNKPLHKRPIYQRIFYSLQHWMAGGQP
jgi:hypothetical protein